MVLLLGVLIPAKVVHADVNDFTINSFDADYTLNTVNKHGSMHVTERIDLTFSDNNHGFLRAIPDSYKDHSLGIKLRSVSSPTAAPSEYSTYKQNGNLVVKIGSPTQTVTGHQSYVLDYDMQEVISFYGDHDELYWDINGDQWAQPFTHVTARIHVPEGSENGQLQCYAGGYGQNEQNCTITKQTDGSVLAATAKPLESNQTLTVVLGFKKGVFAPYTAADWFHDNVMLLAVILAPPLVVGAWAFHRWWKYGKDLKGRGVIVPEYAPPDALLPAEVGTVYDYKLTSTEISATIIDLAIKKHLVIIEETEKKLLKDKKVYIFKRTDSDTSKLSDYELQILNAIFPSLSAGTEVKLDSLKNNFYTTVKALQSKLPKDLTTKGYFEVNPMTAGNRLFIAAAILFFVAFALHSVWSIGLALAALLCFAFAFIMPRRSVKGVATKDAIEGLKLYMNTAEKDRLQMLQSVDAKYAPQSSEPKQSVDLFEKLLPYAMVLGVEQTWAKQFEGLYTTPPDWYSGNWQTFNAVYFASSLTNTMSAMSSSFAPPSNSGSSGFGGGGFSGGGGGGGGGGGW